MTSQRMLPRLLAAATVLAVLPFSSCTAWSSAAPDASSPAAAPTSPETDPTTTPAAATAAPTTPAATPSTPTPSSEPATLTGRVIVIDPGHNRNSNGTFIRHKVPAGNGKTKACNSTGTATNAGYAEHTYNWAQANALATELRARGATVKLTRSSDGGNGPCVNTRASLANELDADLLISIHADGTFSKGARGFHVILSTVMAGGGNIENESRRLAEQIRAILPERTGMPRSTYIGKGTALSPRSDIATLNFAKVPAVMMEMGNMRNPKDAALFTSSAWRTTAAVALADAISAYLS